MNERYSKPRQTPYTAVEPLSKNCLILLPQRATLQDVQALKNAAYRAELEGKLSFAQQLWVRCLAASPADQDGIAAIGRIAIKQTHQASSSPSSPPATAGSRSIAVPVSEAPSEAKAPSPAPPAPPLAPSPAAEVKPESAPEREAKPPPPVQQDYRVERLETPDSPKPAAPTFEFDVVTISRIEKGGLLGLEKPQVKTQRRKSKAEYRREYLGGDVGLDLVLIPGGSFKMGSPDGQGDTDERPQHKVIVNALLMGKYPVTQAQWKAVTALPKVDQDLDADPSKYKGDSRPVERVSWDDAVEFCKRLSKKTDREYRLPSEAEWEYACRAETTTPFHFGSTITTALANYRGTDWEYKGKTYLGSYEQGPKGEYRKRTTDVGSFPANALGLYDMHGNVWEWCLDHWHDNYDGAPTDGSAWLSPDDNAFRLLRGGSWYVIPDNCRSANRVRVARASRYNRIGFRVVCVSSWTL